MSHECHILKEYHTGFMVHEVELKILVVSWSLRGLIATAMEDARSGLGEDDSTSCTQT